MATFLIWQLVLDALAPLGADAVRGGSGAIYFFVKLPDGTDDIEIVERLTAEFGVCP